MKCPWNHAGGITLSPNTDIVHHTCAVTQTLQNKGETTFY